MRNAGLLRATAACFLLSALGVTVSSAQTLNTIITFNGTNLGSNPGALVEGTDGNVYGVTPPGGGLHGWGTAFQFSVAGTPRPIYQFCSVSNCDDGGSPSVILQGSDGDLYGGTTNGGLHSGGVAFRLTFSGTLIVLYNFCSIVNCGDGGSPTALVQGGDGNFYGATAYGGPTGREGGTVFELTPSGTLTTLYSFCSQTNCADGGYPSLMLQGSDGNFYGTTSEYGGGLYCSTDQAGCGTVFRITPAGIFTTVYNFCSLPNCADGYVPTDLIQGGDGNFYGTTRAGGAQNGSLGTVFQLTPSGTLRTLYSFCSLAKCADGSAPNALVQGGDGNFYGVASEGGANAKGTCRYIGCGTFFQLTSGGVLTTLYNFCSLESCIDGELPAGLVQARNTLYGTASGGGSRLCTAGVGCGTVWSWLPDVGLAPTFTPTSLNFGDQAVNTASQAKSVYIKNINTGNATLDFSNFTVSPPFAISSQTCGTTLAAGQTCNVSITFSPTVLGAVNGTLSITDNAPGSPQLVPLAGTGVAQATVTPTSLAFGTVKVGGTSGYKRVTLKNNLPTTLTGISYSTQGPFEVSASTCGTTLASKTSCTISVRFSPTTIGPASGTLNVTDSANNSPQSVSLSGTGD